MNEIIFFIKDVGFPIGVSIYLLFVLQKTLHENTAAMTDLKLVIQKLCDKTDMSGRPQGQP